MIEETGRVVAVEQGAVWVETIRKSACDSCSSQKGCGHSVLAKLGSGKNHVRVLNNFSLSEGDEVVIGIPEDVVVKGSLMAYFLPLLTLLFASVVGQLMWDTEAYTIGCGVAGLGVGFLLVRWHFLRNENNRRYQPSVVKAVSDSHFGVCKIYPA